MILAHQTAGSLFRNYNLLLDMAAEYEGLEALVLVHQDAELDDLDFATKVREALRDPDVAIVGCVGAVGVRSIAWWQGAVTWASVTHRYPEYGGGDTEAAGWDPDKLPSYAHPGEVDSIDGVVMVLSPWAVRELRFDESLGNLHGYDFDICMQAKAAGKKVVTTDFHAIHHHSLELINDAEAWTQSYIRLVEKWNGRLPDTGADPEQRALRSEAEAACARGISVSNQLRNQAIRRQLARLEGELASTKAELKAAKRQLVDAGRELRSAESPGDGGARQAIAPPPGKARVIDYAVDELGIESFASLEIADPLGLFAFYAIDKPTVQHGALIDVRARRPRSHLLSAIEQASRAPRHGGNRRRLLGSRDRLRARGGRRGSAVRRSAPARRAGLGSCPRAVRAGDVVVPDHQPAVGGRDDRPPDRTRPRGVHGGGPALGGARRAVRPPR